MHIIQNVILNKFIKKIVFFLHKEICLYAVKVINIVNLSYRRVNLILKWKVLRGNMKKKKSIHFNIIEDFSLNIFNWLIHLCKNDFWRKKVLRGKNAKVKYFIIIVSKVGFKKYIHYLIAFLVMILKIKHDFDWKIIIFYLP